jgi:hypothetical protein
MRSVIGEMHARGIRLALDGEKIKMKGKKSALTEDAKAFVRAHREEILTALRFLESLRAHMKGNGYALLRDRDGEEIIVTRDADVKLAKKLAKGRARYTLAELHELADMDRAGRKQIRDIKLEFSGAEICPSSTPADRPAGE